MNHEFNSPESCDVTIFKHEKNPIYFENFDVFLKRFPAKKKIVGISFINVLEKIMTKKVL